jgi:hypothetical protein
VFDPVQLPKQPQAAFRCQVGKGDGSDPGDGILFRVAVVEPDGKETLAAEKPWGQHGWTPLHADLSQWAGRRVRVKLIADVGRADHSSGDWASWAEMRIESLEPVLELSLHDRPVALRHEPGPCPPKNLTIEDLRKVKKATLHLQGIGLQCGGQYVSQASLNGMELGALPAAGGDERKGTWGDASLALPAEAIASLGKWNRLKIRNPGRDCFKIRRVWIDLELPGGRRCSSQIATTTYTQPPAWQYAEGTGVPFGEQIEVAIRIQVRPLVPGTH